MNDGSAAEITGILQRWRDGDREALDRLIPLIYPELHRIAHARLARERAGHSLESAELVHETWLRMVGRTRVEWNDRIHFFAASSRIIRNILIDHARARQRERRGGGVTLVALNEAVDGCSGPGVELMALDDALSELAKLDDRQSRIVEMRFFGGLGIEEVAEVLGISRATVNRDWVTARAWLSRRMKSR